jgi:hypothetical protein
MIYSFYGNHSHDPTNNQGPGVGGDMVKPDLRAIQHYKAQDERV